MYLFRRVIISFAVGLLCYGILASAETTKEQIDDGKTTTTTTEETTTTTDETTTTTETTTTPTTTTTTETTTMTTTTPTTTTTPKSTTTGPPAPKYDYFYNITEKNVTCIMIDGNLAFTVTYNFGANKTNQTTVTVPKPSPNVQVNGTCNSVEEGYAGTQFISLSWGSSNPENSVSMRFNHSSDGRTWELINFSSVIFLDKNTFINASDAGKALYSEINFEMTPYDIAVNHSFKCFTKLNVKNISTLMENSTYIYPVDLNIDGIQLQAFNRIAHQTKFVDEVHCEADKIADIVPIAVGCALAGLVIIVLIAYIVGRRRRSAAYQSV